MDEHDLVVAVKELALELGQTPTVSQFKKHVRNAQARIESSEFRRYSRLVEAAGLAPSRGQKITNEIFERPIEQHVENYVPKERKAIEPYPTIATISDIHWPFHSNRVVNKFLEYVGDVKPQYVFINGDAFDMYSHAKFPRSHNIFTPRDEERLSKESNTKFWKDVQARSPKSKCIQLLGNHDIRPVKRVLESYPAAEDWIVKYLKDLFTFEKVETIFDPRQEYLIGNIAVFHGYRSKLGEHRDYTHMNCINGHTHVGGAVFRNIGGQTLWELNSGLAGDPEAKGLTYTPQKITNWTNGFGGVNKNGPQFIPA